jgi:hypothetical protein
MIARGNAPRREQLRGYRYTQVRQATLRLEGSGGLVRRCR